MTARNITGHTIGHTTITADITAQLRRNGVADVDDSVLARSLYSTDASLYRVIPQTVVRPRDTSEVMAVIDTCRQAGVPLTTRGAGTSIAGNAVGEGVVMDLSKHLNRVIDIDTEARRATVQPGIVHAALQRRLAGSGLRFGPDPSTHTRCTIGGMIGNNACGNRALSYGRAADNIAGLRLATIGGERLDLGAQSSQPADFNRPVMLDRLGDLVAADLETIRTEFGTFGRQVSGYSMEHLLPENRFDTAAFVAGTEGTLGVILEATVDLVADEPQRQLVVLGYASMAEAADAVNAILEFSPITCEGISRRIADVFGGTGKPVPELPRGEGFLFVELAGDDAAEIADRAQRVIAASESLGHRHVTEPAEQAALWRIREEGAGLAARTFERPALSGWEDAAVPPARLGEYMREFEALMEAHELHGAPYGHFGDGCVHVRIDFPMDEPDGTAGFRRFLNEAAELVAGFGGSMSGEHGDGRARSELLPAMYSSRALKLFAGVKDVFDPDNLLNPGVLVDPAPFDADLRGSGHDWLRRMGTGRAGLRLADDPGGLGTAVHRCTGVGKCRADNTASGGVMCPSYVATGDEKDSTRGRARVLQEMIDGRLVDGGFSSPEVHEALDLCLSCKGCLSDCPTGVDMASYKAIVLDETYRGKIRPRSHYILGRLPFWARLTAPFARLANAVMRVPGIVHLARWLAGVDQRRSLPAFAPTRFGRLTAGRRAGNQYQASRKEGNRVLLWVDSFTEYFSTGPGMAMIRVLESAGYTVETLAKPQCCGLTWITTGQLDHARRLVRSTVDALYPYAEAGVPIIGVEPSCTAVMRSDATELLDDPRAEAVAGAVTTLAELLARTADWQPPDLSGRNIVVQPHCHHHAVMGFEADASLLQRTGAAITRLGGCCGLAGNFGVEKGHYDVSVKVAEHDLLPAVRSMPEGSIVLADGFSCRTQLDDLAATEAVSLAELLAGPPVGRTSDRSRF